MAPQRWQAELSEQEEIFQALQVQVDRAKEAGAELGKLHPDRSPELERYQERANQMAERWSGVKRQTETRQSDLEVVGSALQQYRENHSALIRWIEETTERQESAQPGQMDSKALSEQLAQQTALVAEIEQNQTKLDECQTYSKQYCEVIKKLIFNLDFFMDLRTRYTALVTLTTQHVKYISDALRRLEEEEKEVEEEKQARVGQVSELLGWVKGLQGRTRGPSAESSLAAQQVAISEQLAGRKEQVAEAIRSTQGFLSSKQATKLSPEERAQVEAQLEELTATYNQLLDSSTQQLQQLEQQLAEEEERKEVQKDLQSKAAGVAEAIRSVEEFLAEKGESLSPEEKKNLQMALERLKEQYGALTDSANTSLSELDTAISTTVQQNTQRVSPPPPRFQADDFFDFFLLRFVISAPNPVTDSYPFISALISRLKRWKNYRKHKSELQQLQAQQAQLLQVTQATRSLLDQPDSTVPPEEKQRLRAALDQLQAQKSEALKDELSKFLQEHGNLGTWLEQSEQEMRSLGEGETDLGEDVICHKADLRFVSISGQKVLDSVQGALEQAKGSDPSLEGIKQLVSDKLQDANHRYTTLHTKVRRSAEILLFALSRQSWAAVCPACWSALMNKTKASPSPAVTPTQIKSRLAGRDLVSTEESPSLKAVDILCKRFGSLSASVSERAEHLQTAVAQSVSVQEGLKGLLSWLDKLVLNPRPVKPTALAVQDALTQNQKLRQELLSRQGSVEATRDSLSKLLQSSDAAAAPGLHGSLDELTQRYTAAQTSQAEREAELKGLLPRLESYERLGTDLQAFTQSRLKALSPVGQPDRSMGDYRQTIEEVKSELEQETGQLKSFCNLGTELSQSRTLSDTQSLLDNVKGVTEGFTKLEENVNER
uniref:Dystonin n=1 Tax=Cyprinodon variegatus TaxID=28743 RepID=A0A3Q2DDQ7_CYPVA